MQRGLPLIWFRGVASAAYLPLYPVYLVAEEPHDHQFVVALNAESVSLRDELGRDDPDLVRTYAERLAKVRLHQPLFRQNDIGLSLGYYWFETAHYLCRLRSMAPRANFQIEVRFWNFKLRKEHIRHVSIVVLPGVHQRLPQTLGSDGAQYRRCLYEVGTRANNMKNVIQGVLFSLATEMREARPLSNDDILDLCSLRRNVANSSGTALFSPER